MFKTLIKLNRISTSVQSSRNNLSSSLLVEKIDSLLHLKLNRPNERNSLNGELIRRLIDQFMLFEENNQYRSVLLNGSGGNFCCGLDVNEIQNENTLKLFSDLLQLFPLKKPSIVAIEGYALCAGLQLALVFDYRIIENDSVLQLNNADHLPFHPYVKQLYNSHNLIELFGDTNEKVDIKNIIQKHIILQNCVSGCCFGVGYELAKCMEKFPIESIIYDRKKLYELSDKSLIDSKKDHLSIIMSDKTIDSQRNVYTRAKRFLDQHVGRHGASNVDTIDEIYLNWMPKLVQENEL